MEDTVYSQDTTPSTSPFNPPPTMEQLQQQIQMQQLISSFQPLLQSTPSIPPPPPPTSSSSTPAIPVTPSSSNLPLKDVAPPDPFDGTMSQTETFLTQLSLYFYGKRVENDSNKIVFTLSYMKGGSAGPWARVKTEGFSKAGAITMTWVEFLEELQETFGDPNPASTARHKLKKLKQNNQTAEQYITSFKELASATGYNDAALVECFEEGLNDHLVDKIYALPRMPTTLSGWMDWAVRLDRQWRQRQVSKKELGISQSKSSQPARSFKPLASSSQSPSPAPSSQSAQPARQPNVVPMEVDSDWRSIKPLICYKCKRPGHKSVHCKSQVDINSMDYDSLKSYFKDELQREKQSSKDF